MAEESRGLPGCPAPNRELGITLLEIVISTSVMLVILGSIVAAMNVVQGAFAQNQLLSQLHLRAETAMERLVSLTSQALTTDKEFSPIGPAGKSGLRFRLLKAVNTDTGDPVFTSEKVFICGPENGVLHCEGLVLAAGESFESISAFGSGPDGTLGTVDDQTAAHSGNKLPAMELLVPDRLRPRSGRLFTSEWSSGGRLVTFTLRLNARDAAGQFLLPNDLVLKESVALRQ